jgi:hypothetical protein
VKEFENAVMALSELLEDRPRRDSSSVRTEVEIVSYSVRFFIILVENLISERMGPGWSLV